MPTTIGSPYKNEAGFGGEAITTSQSTNATIVSIDASTKMMKLKMPDGALRTYGVDVDVVRRGKAKAGDAVKVVTAEEHTLFVGADSPAEDDGPVPNSIHMPAGSSPLVRSTATKTYAAKVTAIDAWNDSVTLRLSDGRTKTTQLTPNFNLADVRVGDEISIRISEATLILLDQ